MHLAGFRLHRDRGTGAQRHKGTGGNVAWANLTYCQRFYPVFSSLPVVIRLQITDVLNAAQTNDVIMPCKTSMNLKRLDISKRGILKRSIRSRSEIARYRIDFLKEKLIGVVETAEKVTRGLTLVKEFGDWIGVDKSCQN